MSDQPPSIKAYHEARDNTPTALDLQRIEGSDSSTIPKPPHPMWRLIVAARRVARLYRSRDSINWMLIVALRELDEADRALEAT